MSRIVNALHLVGTSPATSTTTGTLVVDGGLGVAGDTYVGGTENCNALYSTGTVNCGSMYSSGGITAAELDIINGYTGSTTVDAITAFAPNAAATVNTKIRLGIGLGVADNSNTYFCHNRGSNGNNRGFSIRSCGIEAINYVSNSVTAGAHTMAIYPSLSVTSGITTSTLACSSSASVLNNFTVGAANLNSQAINLIGKAYPCFRLQSHLATPTRWEWILNSTSANSVCSLFDNSVAGTTGHAWAVQSGRDGTFARNMSIGDGSPHATYRLKVLASTDNDGIISTGNNNLGDIITNSISIAGSKGTCAFLCEKNDTAVSYYNSGRSGIRMGIDAAQNNPYLTFNRGKTGQVQASSMYWDWAYADDSDYDFRFILSNSTNLQLLASAAKQFTLSPKLVVNNTISTGTNAMTCGALTCGAINCSSNSITCAGLVSYNGAQVSIPLLLSESVRTPIIQTPDNASISLGPNNGPPWVTITPANLTTVVPLATTTLTASGTISAAGLTLSGPITGTPAASFATVACSSLTASGTISAAGLALTGPITGAPGATLGTVACSTLSTSGAINAGTYSLSCGTLSCGSMVSGGGIDATGYQVKAASIYSASALSLVSFTNNVVINQACTISKFGVSVYGSLSTTNIHNTNDTKALTITDSVGTIATFASTGSALTLNTAVGGTTFTNHINGTGLHLGTGATSCNVAIEQNDSASQYYNTGNTGLKLGRGYDGNPYIQFNRGRSGFTQATAMYEDWAFTDDVDYDFRWIMTTANELRCLGRDYDNGMVSFAPRVAFSREISCGNGFLRMQSNAIQNVIMGPAAEVVFDVTAAPIIIGAFTDPLKMSAGPTVFQNTSSYTQYWLIQSSQTWNCANSGLYSSWIQLIDNSVAVEPKYGTNQACSPWNTSMVLYTNNSATVKVPPAHWVVIQVYQNSGVTATIGQDNPGTITIYQLP